MTDLTRTNRVPDEFLPKIVTVFREGYRASNLKADALAGLTVAIVALPLSMAIAIASGVGPERGLNTAIIGGFLVSAFGGSRYQIGGPAGAFIVLISACVMAIGLPGLITATFLSGFILIVAGLLRLGTYIKFIPYPVTVGFTAGIGVIIFASQIKELFGLTLAGPEPAEIIAKLQSLWDAKGSVTPQAVGVALITIVTILAVRRFKPHWPGMLIAVVLTAIGTATLGMPIETIGSRFGALPNLPPLPVLPAVDAAALTAALPWALSFALLGAIESLLSAVVADGMSGARHRSNAELVGQGVANIGAALFGGFCVTGTIARTATNVRAGSHGPVSGMLHALFLLAFMAVAAPYAAYIPLAALAGVLALVSWGMVEKEEFWNLVRASRGDALIILTTFLLVVFRDLTEGIVVGFAIAGLVFIKRMSDATGLRQGEVPVEEGGPPMSDVMIYHLNGPFFFGAAAQVGGVLDRIAERPRIFAVDFTDVPMIDSSGAKSFDVLARKLHRKGGQLCIVGAPPQVRAVLLAQGLREPHARYLPDLAALRECAASRS
ncbi:SulP family inorganic anion transporter [Rhodobacter sp. Har01]|uniref:SulP family inorganic anion transporter n=1 Tax=Rhodobacter sp. Har01 TaxID=2883999 RepID=UPI001D06A741|nr:SulP family inorganic anion transporter [Rhodobacter sp. Har01]MCB6178468.1 SulP family inorganic anion transporter [Rhodobacter sp. Har01]